MLQRIQTIYYLLASIMMMAYIFVKLATIGDTLIVKATGTTLNGAVLDTPHLPSWLLVAMAIICLGFTDVSLFVYNKRPLQIKLTGASILLTTVLAVISFIQLDKIRLHEMPEATIVYNIGSYLPVAAIAFLILAYRGVKKDEDLVRSVDRLR
jgi:glucan phosphoethanolaminetransferase (alkaline phosphatase superfamily)